MFTVIATRDSTQFVVSVMNALPVCLILLFEVRSLSFRVTVKILATPTWPIQLHIGIYWLKYSYVFMYISYFFVFSFSSAFHAFHLIFVSNFMFHFLYYAIFSLSLQLFSNNTKKLQQIQILNILFSYLAIIINVKVNHNIIVSINVITISSFIRIVMAKSHLIIIGIQLNYE